MSNSLSPWGCSMPGFPVLHHLQEFAQTHVHWVSDAIQPSHPLSSPSPPAFNLSQHQSFPMSQVSSHQVAQVLELPALASILPMNIQDWFPLGLTAWISLQSNGLSIVFSTPQFKSINSLAFSLLYGPTLTSIHDYWKNHCFDWTKLCGQIYVSAFFVVQLSHAYVTTRKTIALTSRTFVGKVMSLLLNMLSRFVIAFLPRSNCLLISWLQSPSAVIFEPKK